MASFCAVGTTGMNVMGAGKGAQFPARGWGFPAHLPHICGSLSILIKTPPTTERAWKPTCLPLSVWYQSVMGTREGEAFKKAYTGATSTSKSCLLSARVAVQIVQSSFV